MLSWSVRAKVRGASAGGGVADALSFFVLNEHVSNGPCHIQIYRLIIGFGQRALSNARNHLV